MRFDLLSIRGRRRLDQLHRDGRLDLAICSLSCLEAPAEEATIVAEEEDLAASGWLCNVYGSIDPYNSSDLCLRAKIVLLGSMRSLEMVGEVLEADLLDVAEARERTNRQRLLSPGTTTR
jgi:hypothetical protein